MSSVELSFVMPAFNEEAFIEDALDMLDRVVKKTKLRYEIVVIDDGSVDGTRVRAIRYASRNGHVRVIGYANNLGKGHAEKTGFVHSAGEIIVFVDSDMEIDLKKVSTYLEALRCGDIAIASKWHPDSIVDLPLIRRILSHGFNLLVRLMTGVKLRDTQTGLKAIRKKAFEQIFPRLAVKRYAFDVELLAVANLSNLKVVELPVTIKIESMFSLREVWSMFIDLLGITYRLRVLHSYQKAPVGLPSQKFLPQ